MHRFAAHYLFAASLQWTAIFWGSFAGVFLVSYWAHAREHDLPMGDMRDRGSYIFLVIFSQLAIVSAFAAPVFIPVARIGLPPMIVFSTAIAMCWAGILIYAASILTLGPAFRSHVQLLDGQKLVTTGLYRILRHPAYTGGILMFAGLSLAMGNWLSFAIATLSVTIGYARRIQVEEIALRDRFGSEFDAHKKRTWAVFPFVW